MAFSFVSVANDLHSDATFTRGRNRRLPELIAKRTQKFHALFTLDVFYDWSNTKAGVKSCAIDRLPSSVTSGYFVVF